MRGYEASIARAIMFPEEREARLRDVTLRQLVCRDIFCRCGSILDVRRAHLLIREAAGGIEESELVACHGCLEQRQELLRENGSRLEVPRHPGSDADPLMITVHPPFKSRKTRKARL